jgi:hypothetical protein
MPTLELAQRGSGKRDPFQLKWNEKRLATFTDWIVNEIRQGISARSRLMQDGGLIDAWHDAYEQAERVRSGPWPGAADLSSWIIAEKVDAMKARILQTVFGVDPICMVEGWGETSDRAAKVEAFHQWKADDERLRTWLDKGIHLALIEGNGILECSERAVMRRSVSEQRLMTQVDPNGSIMLSDQNLPMPAVGEDGKMIPWNGQQDAPSLTAKVAEIAYVSQGPQYRAVSCKDFLMLAAHAASMEDVWGFAKRFYRRMPELKEREKAGWYQDVDRLGNAGERDQHQEDRRQHLSIAPQMDETAEKELWEVQCLYDVQGDGIEQWVLATVSEKHNVTIRVQEDDLNQTRYININPYPRPTSVWGYSYAGDKLWTLNEEHAAMRNTIADRSAMVTSAPIKKSSTSKWNPDEQPWGPRSVITVQTMNEIEPVAVPDVPQSALYLKRDAEQAAERVSGLNDVGAIGVSPGEGQGVNPTATQVATQSKASFVRVDDPLHHVQESVSDLYLLRHRIWEKTLSTMPDGLEASASALIGLITRGLTLPQDGPFTFTAADLQGNWKFTPRGSTETADLSRKRSSLNEFVGAVLPRLAQMFPQIGQAFMLNPKIGQVILTDMLRAYGLSSLMPYLMGSPTAPPQVNPMSAMLPNVMQQLGAPGGNVVPFAPPGMAPAPPPQQQAG